MIVPRMLRPYNFNRKLPSRGYLLSCPYTREASLYEGLHLNETSPLTVVVLGAGAARGDALFHRDDCALLEVLG